MKQVNLKESEISRSTGAVFDDRNPVVFAQVTSQRLTKALLFDTMHEIMMTSTLST